MAPYSFGRDRRLRNHTEFARAQRAGRRVGTPHFILLVARQPDGAAQPTLPRLGLVLTRKVGGSVVRNRIRRICRECFRTWPDLLPAGVDLIVIARAGAQDVSLADARSEWRAVEKALRERARQALSPQQPHSLTVDRGL
jgi:ribonuclease P protein component